MTVYDENLNKSRLGKLPNPFKLAQALRRPDQPFVMINLLLYKEQASGNYAHLSGEEAYKRYAQSVEKAQAPLGSRLLWSGTVQHKLTAGKAPRFHSIGLLEYASPKAFWYFATKGGSDVRARGAGLLGQWLIAAATLEEARMPDFDEAHGVLIECCSGISRTPEAAKLWQDIRGAVYQAVGGKTLWHGRCDHHLIGAAQPRIDDVLVTCFPDTSALQQSLDSLNKKGHFKSLQSHLAYTAKTMLDFLPGLREVEKS